MAATDADRPCRLELSDGTLGVSHAASLIDALQSEPDCHAILLRKTFGDTPVDGTLEPPRWEWPAR